MPELPDRYQPDWAALETATNENPFMSAGVELLKEVGVLSVIVAGAIPEQPYDRDQAIRCGLLIRIMRLGLAMLRDTCVGDGEQQMSLCRQVLDSVTTLLYLLDDQNGERHGSYVEDSLVAERELLKTIQQRQKETAAVLPIEERMRRSVEESAKAAGVDPSTVPSRKKIGWPSAEVRSRELGPTAYVAYRMGSATLHGTWHAVYRNYLREVDGGFQCTVDPPSPRPQPLLTVTLLMIDCTGRYIQAGPPAVRAFITPQLADLRDRTGRVDALHESFLQERRTPSSE